MDSKVNCAGGSVVNELAKEVKDQLGVMDDSKSTEVDLTVVNLINYEGEYPVRVEKNEILGRYLVAKRDISSGEIILRDKPIFMAPNAGSVPTCLGCCVQTENPVPCPSCGWSLCGIECENISVHANNECEIFSKNKIEPELPPPYCFVAGAEFIKILRCLLLSTGKNAEDKRKWDIMQTLEAHVETRKSVPKILFMSNLAKPFIQELCKLDQFDGDTINFILGVIDVNAFRHTIHPNNPLRQDPANMSKTVDRNATFLYPIAAMAAHGCRRNCRWETGVKGEMEMHAAENIPEGRILTHPYVDLMAGTPDRRQQLRDQFYFDCSCTRCSDPTELGTFFSALKCPECKTGNLLAVNPLDYNTAWKCTNLESCQCEKTSEYERNLVAQIQSEEKIVMEMLEFGSNLAIIGGLVRILGKYQGKKVHTNHYTLINVEYNLVTRMAKINKPSKELLLQMRKMIHKFLDIADVFYPGIK